jgi:hypothetical protein
MLRCFVVGVTLLLGGRSALADDDLDVPGLDGDLRGDALVWEDATFYLEPWDGGLAVRLSPYGRPRAEMVGNAVPVHITSTAMKQFVEIELAPRADCVWRRWAPDRRVEALRLFVHRDDLAPVLVKPFSATYSDGTRIKLQPGVPVLPTPSGQYSLGARGDRFRAAIPHSSVGYTYTAGRVAEPELPAAGKIYRLDRSATATLNGETLAVRAQWLAPEPTRNGEHALVHWAARCIDLIVDAPSSGLRVTEHPRPPTAPAPPPPLRPTGFYIPAGAPLATEAGRDVAVAAIPIPVSAPGGDVVCFDATLAINKDDELPYSYPGQLARTVKLCTSSRLVERDP